MVKPKKNSFSLKFKKKCSTKNIKKQYCNFSTNNLLLAAVQKIQFSSEILQKKYITKRYLFYSIFHQKSSLKVVIAHLSLYDNYQLKGVM